VTRARCVFAVQAALGALAAGVLALSLAVALTGISLRAPSADELAQACQRFALPDVSVASVVALALGSVAVAAIVLAVRSAVRQLRASRRFIARLRVVGPGPEGSVLFAADSPQAFCAGLLAPRVYVSTAAVASLRPEELGAVLAHEGHHARLRDPLRVLVARTLSDALFSPGR
jgi:Zn-dependent protease with chaperone function